MEQQNKSRTSQTLIKRINEILQDVPLIDGHNDLPWRIRHDADGDIDSIDFTGKGPSPFRHTDLKRLRKGGIGAQFWAIYLPEKIQGSEAAETAMVQIEMLQSFIAKYSDDLEIANTASEIERIHKEVSQ